jgi:cobalt-precorrin-7 (C5)-methyltransferase
MLYVVGTGLSEKDLTREAIQVIRNANVIYSSRKVFERVRGFVDCKKLRLISNFSEKEYMKIFEESRNRDVVVLSSGDPMVSGLGSRFSRLVEEVTIIPGISSVQKALAILRKDLTEVVVVSTHGREDEDLTLYEDSNIFKTRGLLILADRSFDLKKLKGRKIVLMENLGMEGERIVEDFAENVEIKSDYSIVYLGR